MTAVRIGTFGSVLIITIEAPPINASSHAVREGLIAAIDELAQRFDIDAAVLIGAGSTFIAGANIR